MMKRQNGQAAELLPRGHNLKLLFTHQLREYDSTVSNFVGLCAKVRGFMEFALSNFALNARGLWRVVRGRRACAVEHGRRRELDAKILEDQERRPYKALRR